MAVNWSATESETWLCDDCGLALDETEAQCPCGHRRPLRKTDSLAGERPAAEDRVNAKRGLPMPDQEMVRTTILLETDGVSECYGPPVEAAIVEVSRAQFEADDIEDWWPIKVIETCGHRHKQTSKACSRCYVRMGGGPGWH